MRILVVDDEAPARARLVRLLGDLGHTTVLEAADAAAARPLLAATDVVLLDVSMPGVDGLSFAALERLPTVVFVTGDPSHAARAFDVEAADFVTKPVTRERLARALERARRKAVLAPSGESVRLRVLEGSVERYLDAARVEVFRAEAKYVAFDEGGRERLVRESLDELEARLPGGRFVRTHRGFLVRLDAIAALHAEPSPHVVLRSGASVPVARRALADVRARLRT